MDGKKAAKFDRCIKALQRAIPAPHSTARQECLESIRSKLRPVSEVVLLDDARLQLLLDTTCMAREATGPGSGRLEQDLMDLLIDIASKCDADCDAGQLPPDRRLAVFERLAPFARDCLALKRVRDSNGACRKIGAFRILAQAMRHMDLPECVEEARKVVFSPRASAIEGALVLLGEDSRKRDAPLDAALVQRLHTLIDKATSRSSAVRILSFLVDTGEISEFTAVDLLDRWRERQRRG